MKFTNKQHCGITNCIDSALTWVDISKQFIYSFFRANPKWDPWLIKDDGVYRLFYLSGSKFAYPFWKVAKICGATSNDMKEWKDIGILLQPEPNHPWEAGRMLAGCTYKENNTYYLFYSAAKAGIEIYYEGIGLATSTDGLRWQRCSSHELLIPDDRWYIQHTDYLFWRDPYIFKDPNTQKYYLFISSHSKRGGFSRFRGCIALAIADKITGPYELLPPAAAPLVCGTDESPYFEMERPQVFYKYGKYHLFFSCWREHINPKWLRKVESDRITNSSLYWYVSDSITGLFNPVSEIPVVIGSEKMNIYGINFFLESNKSEQMVAYGWCYKSFNLKTTSLFKVYWDEDSIKIIS